MKFFLNGTSVEFNGESDTPLLWVIREHFQLTGTKFGCGIGACGACTVHVAGQGVRSCCYPLKLVEGKQVVTIEGLGPEQLHPVQQAWIDEDVPQCGYCQSGMIMAVSAELANSHSQGAEQLCKKVSNICRCATYCRIRKAIDRLYTDRTETALVEKE